MKWLVTGANGMLGSDLVDLLKAAGEEVTAATRTSLDVTDPDAVNAAVEGHGVVVNDFNRNLDDYAPAGHVLALQATALDGGDTSLEGLLRISQAQNWNDFLAAVDASR